MVVSNVLKYCVILIYAKIYSVFPSGVQFLHTLFLENEAQASEKNKGQCCLTEMEVACENYPTLAQCNAVIISDMFRYCDLYIIT